MPLTLYRRGRIWHYRGSVAGRRLRGSTRTADKAVAARAAAQIEQRYWTGHLDGPGAVLTFAQAAILYRAAGKPVRHLAAVEDYWRDALVKDIAAGDVRRAALEICARHSNATRNRHVIVPTQAIINHAADSGLCAPIRVKRFPVESKIKRPATWDWVRRFMAASPPHLAALACFMFLTGARVSEALAVQWSDIDFARRRVVIRQSKTGAERAAHLPPALLAALAGVKREPGRGVFRYTAKASADKSWRAAVKRAGIAPLSFHCCRHGFATALLHAGVDVVTIARLGGWKTAQHVLATYGHAREDMTLTDRIVGTNLTQPAANGAKKKTKTTG